MGASKSRVVNEDPNFTIGMSDGLNNRLNGHQGGGQSGSGAGDSAAPDSGSTTYRRVPERPTAAALQEAYDQGLEDMRKNLETEVSARVEEEYSRRSQIDGYEASASASQYERGVVQQQLDSAMVAEDDRVRTVAAYAEELSKRQPSTPERPLQCTSERSACVKCYEDAINNKKLPTECAQFVDAFAKCAASVQKDFVSRGMPTP